MSTPSVYEMRDIIARVYKSETWKEKVKHMSEKQVMGVYFSFLEQGKFDKKPVKPLMGYEPTKRAEPVVTSKEDFVYCPTSGVLQWGEQLAFDI